jgi:hypothetical protein
MKFTSIVLVISLMSFSVASITFADEDHYINAGYDMGKYPNFSDDEKMTVINGFAIDWPIYTGGFYLFAEMPLPPGSRQEQIAEFQDYYDGLSQARLGAELVNKFAFDIYKKIADDGEDTLYYSPYGVYTALLDFVATSAFAASNDIFNEETRAPVAKLKEIIYGNFINKLTKREEHKFNQQMALSPYGSSDKQLIYNMDFLRTGRTSSFNISNSVSTYKLDVINKYDVSLSLTNSTSLDLQFLGANELDLYAYSGVWLEGVVLYAQADEFELTRIRFDTLKHSLLLINPIDENDFKKIERALDINTINKLFLDMKLKNYAFRFDWKLFDNGKDMAFDLNSTGITEGTSLINFNHYASFVTGRYVHRDFIGWGTSTATKPETLATRYEHVIPLDHPFLFFVIDDPTGAILFMGRSSGQRPEVK